MTMRELSAAEIADLDAGSFFSIVPRLEGAYVSDDVLSDERSRRFELSIKGLTGIFCAARFIADVSETGPDRCFIEWSVRLPNGYARSLAVEKYDGGILEPKTLRRAFQGIGPHANGWGITFNGITPADGMTEEVFAIAAATENAMARLEKVRLHADHLPSEARSALEEALSELKNVRAHRSALDARIDRLKPVDMDPQDD
jgi:hypothetical protein